MRRVRQLYAGVPGTESCSDPGTEYAGTHADSGTLGANTESGTSGTHTGTEYAGTHADSGTLGANTESGTKCTSTESGTSGTHTGTEYAGTHADSGTLGANTESGTSGIYTESGTESVDNSGTGVGENRSVVCQSTLDYTRLGCSGVGCVEQGATAPCLKRS